jgi:hypothetical protein
LIDRGAASLAAVKNLAGKSLTNHEWA